MNSAVLAQLRASGHDLDLSLLVTGRTGRFVKVVIAFPRGGELPVWVAKTSYDRQATGCFARECKALRYLEPWAAELSIPVVIAWDEQEHESCLITTALSGKVRNLQLPVDASEAQLSQKFDAAIDWLLRFESLVPAPDQVSMSQVAEAALERYVSRIPADLAREFRGMIEQSEPEAAIAIHGDFWPLNLLYSGSRIEVVDWDNFGSGVRLHDFFQLFIGSDYYDRDGMCTLPQIIDLAFFADSTTARYIRRHLKRFNAPDRNLRFYFYYCLIRLLGEDTLAESPHWKSLLARLLESGYPAPWTALKTPARPAGRE